MTDINWLLGSVGLLAIEGSYLPQIARLYRLKRSEDVSLFFPALNLLGRVFALVYSASKGEHVFVAGLLLGIALRAALLAQVLWYRLRARRHYAALEVRETRSPSPRALDALPGASA